MQFDAKKYFIKTDACKVCNRRCTRWKHAVRKTQNIGLLEAKHRTFASKVRHFYAKKSDVLVFPGVKRPFYGRKKP